MRRKPIYVEAVMRTTMEQLWEHTQNPLLHKQWDLRFSDIHYLPRSSQDSQQHFLYRTNIGFGWSIKGTGSSKSARESGISTLFFQSDQRISLIKEGSGYWKYIAEDGEMRFQTKFDYKTRGGTIGKYFDALVFRPLFGFATAWSFDVLRIWLEHGMKPFNVIRGALIHYTSVMLLFILWMYQGIVPKLWFPSSMELGAIQQLGFFAGFEKQVLLLLGIFEIGVGLAVMIGHRKKWIYLVQIFLLLALMLSAIVGDVGLLQEPFNPAMLSMAMIAISMAALWTCEFLPQASRCLRKQTR